MDLRTSDDVLKHFGHCRNVSAPLVAVVTPDPEATIKLLCGVLKPEHKAVAWDVVRGMHEPPGKDFGLAAMLKGELDPTIGSPVEFLVTISLPKVPKRALFFMHLADRWLKDPGPPVIQGVKNLRDTFKAEGKCLVLLCCDDQLPPELKHDVIVIDEPLPDPMRLEQIVRSVANDVKSGGTADKDFKVSGDDMEEAVTRLTGLSAFSAEQATVLSMRPKGLDLADLWARKRKLVNQTPGLAVYEGTERFDDLGGVSNVKTFLRRYLEGQKTPKGIVFVDEIEKALAGTQGDTSGTSQGILQSLLTHMQDRGATGSIFIGPPGAAKSAIAKATGNEGGILTIQFDLNGLKGSLVGETEQKCRDALKVIDSVTSGTSCWLATCNNITTLPPELRRRFSLPTFFFDLPDAEERGAIWSIYLAKFKIPAKQKRPDDEGWTGAEIKTCCELAWNLGIDLREAAQYVIPVCKSAPGMIEKLRTDANGRYTSASYPGVFQMNRREATGGRSVEV